eukprot:CCRYP_015619-RA/>CCRYP_015619-RA protein AED:0.00 eAED:0.00 QI:180/-1/1/1/-1/1/1/146/398
MTINAAYFEEKEAQRTVDCPKKSRRVRVKYQPTNSASVAGLDGNAQQDNESLSEDLENDSDLDRGVDQLGIDNDQADRNDVDNVIVEINHLRKRISNIQTSLQTSRGLSNPKIWHTNCLLPVKNAIKEWRSICNYYFSGNAEGARENEGTNNMHQTDPRAARDCILYQDILHETSVQVFSLLQMSMQSGPLVGSNPGYFKRCGGEVASIALEFLNEIVGLAGISDNKSREIVDTNVADELESDGANHETDINEPVCNEDHDCENNDISDHGKDMEVNSTSSSGSNHPSCSGSSQTSASVGTKEDCNAISDKSLSSNQDEKQHPSQSQAIQALQHKLLFSDKQSQRLCQWIQNAQKAVEANKAPSKSANNLQSQKSKKQQSKEMKLERKLKKKKRGGVK